MSSNSGDVDAYVGDGGTAELHSQEGNHNCQVLHDILTFQGCIFWVILLVRTLGCLSCAGAVSVRVSPSLRVGVNLCGASVDISPEVVLHQVEKNTADGCTRLTGELLSLIKMTKQNTVFIFLLPCSVSPQAV